MHLSSVGLVSGMIRLQRSLDISVLYMLRGPSGLPVRLRVIRKKWVYPNVSHVGKRNIYYGKSATGTYV